MSLLQFTNAIDSYVTLACFQLNADMQYLEL